MRGLALDDRTLQPRLGRETGGYSGPGLKPIALAAVYQCYGATGMPIVGMGGISTGRDALEFLAAGAASSRSERSSSPTRTRRAECVASWLASSPRAACPRRKTRPASHTARARSLLPDLTIWRFCGKNALFARVLEAH